MIIGGGQVRVLENIKRLNSRIFGGCDENKSLNFEGGDQRKFDDLSGSENEIIHDKNKLKEKEDEIEEKQKYIDSLIGLLSDFDCENSLLLHLFKVEKSKESRKIEDSRDFLFNESELFWVSPLKNFLEELGVNLEDAANIATKIAKTEYQDDDLVALLMSSLGQALDPKPFRKKWLAFALFRNRFFDHAKEIITRIDGEVSFSASELKAVDKINQLAISNNIFDGEYRKSFEPSFANGSDISRLKREHGVGGDDFVVGYVGSFGLYERLDVLVEACAELVRKGEKIKLLLVGDDQRPNFKNRSGPSADIMAESEMPWLTQIGRVSHQQVSDYYALLDAVVIPGPLPSVDQSVPPPMKAAAALACGKLLVIPDVMLLPESADKYEGLVRFESGNAGSLAQALQGSLKLPAPQPSTELLFSAHTEPMVKALKGRGSVADQKAVAEPPAKLLGQAAPAKSRLGEFSRPETLELPPKDPLWHNVPVKAGQALIIEAASEYHNVKGAQNRKAVLLINAFDAEGKPVDKPCGKLAKSTHLKAYFKYLPCTQNQVQELHSFSVPEGVSEIRVGLCGFNKQDDEQVMLRELRVRPKPDKSQPTQFVPPSAQAAEMSILGWPEQPPNGKPYVIGIMDEFTTRCFGQDVNLIQPRPDNWYALAEKYQPEFFFIESAWKGNYGSWQYRVADYANKPGQEIAHICQYAREKGIPTLFWNKEDPVHHQKFMCSAKLVDHIFTTDANMKDSYQAKTGNTNVNVLPFAAQPALHKPGPLSGRKPRACFAGSWYGNRHGERGEAMRWLLQAANRHGLDIYDRNHGTGIFPFPEEYQADIKGSLPYKALCDEYSRYRVFLNVNSVANSPTMFSRRVFELMACGTPVISTYAKGIENLFESDAVWLVHSQEEADEALRTLMTDYAEWRRRSLVGIREVFAKHTYAHRLNDIFDRLGIETRLPTDPAIGLVAEAHSHAELQALDQFARQQSYRGFHLGIACAPGLAQLAGSLSENITLLQRGEKASWLTEQHAESPLAGWLSPQHHYGEHYLRDLVNASLYEPEAAGWAKALDRDRFAYEGEASVSGALWRTAEFLRQPIKAPPEERITRPDLYLADSDQFQAAGAAQQVVGG
ncbi:glycosyltransferase family protein [Yunchengibacter salinarum]|uniref:glycosyltransferase family protein n=1 Tax=Yunchengibacter salinarum TaxID=3133399 RepID=UPI0035B606EC